MSLPEASDADPAPPVRGVGVRLIAVVLILVGALDMMLSWRGSMQVSSFYVALFTLGIVLYGVGSVLASRGRAGSSSNAPNTNGESA